MPEINEETGLSETLGHEKYDAVVVGSGPNGLAAAIQLSKAGRRVLVVEGYEKVGGGCRSAELTLPGFIHDVCSAIHPLGVASPFFRSVPLRDYGLRWVQPPACLAHPFDDGSAAVLYPSLADTARGLGGDGFAYRRLIGPVVSNWPLIERNVLGPLVVPRHPVALALFGLRSLLPAQTVASIFRGKHARGLFAGISAHSMLPLERPPSAAAGVMLLALAHIAGWPIARGGSQQIADALAAYLRDLGGEIVTGQTVQCADQLPPSDSILFDLTPRQVSSIAGKRLPAWYKRSLSRFRYGPGVFKIDYALDGPVPWRAKECTLAGTVHLGGTLEEVAEAEKAVWEGGNPERPFVLTAQQSLFDPTRAPDGKHTLWAYCHVPNGSTFDMTERIEAQIERFAPGFCSRILARHIMRPSDMQNYNPNYIGGDINGGVQDLRQLFTRPLPRPVPYRTANPGIYICSSSTPPGGGVHGMCGYWAASAVLRSPEEPAWRNRR